jgi:hypothetical protein
VPDPTILAAMGSDAMAYRGLMYMVVEGLVVGNGSVSTDEGGLFPTTSNDGSFTSPLKFPSFQVELVDGATSTGVLHDARMLDTSTPFPFAQTVISYNPATRELSNISQNNTGVGSGGHLHILDMNTAQETECVFITPDPGFWLGQDFQDWDTINDIWYTGTNGPNLMASVDRTGHLIELSSITKHFNISPEGPGSTTPSPTNPAVVFPSGNPGTIDYVIRGGTFQTIVASGNAYVCFLCPSSTGHFPADLLPNQWVVTSDVGGVNPNARTIAPMKIAQKNAGTGIGQTGAYQDAAFVVSWRDHVEMVYVTFDGTRSRVLGRDTIYTATLTSHECRAFVTAEGNIVVQEHGTTDLMSMYEVTFTGVPTTNAAGWRGLFPKVNPSAVWTNTLNDGTWDFYSQVRGDYRGGTLIQNSTLLDLRDGSTTSAASFSGTAASYNIWESLNGIRWYWGNITSGAQTFRGPGFKWGQLFEGINAGASGLNNVLRDISLYAGFTNAQISVDAKLTAGIPGVLIDHPYSLDELFNSMGSIYEFSYFHSGNEVKFATVTNAPDKATGNWLIGNVIDGDTITIGTTTYRLKTIPSQPYDVKLSADTDTANGLTDHLEKTTLNFMAAIAADLSLAASDSTLDGFYPGTLPHTLVTAKVDTNTVSSFGHKGLVVTAIVAGTSGNTIVTSQTGGRSSWSHTTLLGGAVPPPPVINLTIADLADNAENSLSPHDAIITTINPPQSGQSAAGVTFFALDNDYIQATETFVPDNQNGGQVNSNSTVMYNLPIVMATSEAYQRVARTAFHAADNVIAQEFRLTTKGLLLEPADVVSVTIAPFQYTIQITEATFNGDFSTSFAGRNYTSRSDIVVNDSDSLGFVPQSVVSAGDAIAVVIDAPLQNPAYGTSVGNFDLLDGVRAYTYGFTFGTLSYKTSPTANDVQVLQTDKSVKWGLIFGGLPTAVEPYYRTVEDSITLTCKTIIPATELASASYTDFVAGKNCLLVGRPGCWEYIFFRDVTLLSPTSAKLTGLARAQRGTDAAVTNHDAANDVAILVASVATGFTNPALSAQTLANAVIGSTYTYSAVGVPATLLPVGVNVTFAGLTKYPFSPCRLQAAYSSTNIVLTWLRRDRLGTQFVTTAQPLSETSELYDLEILSGTTVVRTVLGLASPTYTYLAAQITADGFVGTLSTLKFRVYQKGELGRGFPRLETVNVN